ncbi:ester cyclase [Actinomadura sp. ATCC 31491]|uniref:Ester cyclase n=1 Tax=Actinomadura luzonensis TaxID=2805427 RepID=A0ABT0FZ39_9ACTN|nr:ester cyclase [Actinomadura luzonensis]MCK2217153.1 ester cyclase [Actinomadura luzonensis]
MDKKDVVRGFIAAVNERRLDDLGNYLAADVVDHNKIIFGEPDEPGAAFEGLKMQLDAFEPFRLTIEDLIQEDERVVARLVMNGVNSGYHPRMPEPTGRRFVAEVIFIFTVTDAARISEIRAVSDRLGMFFQLGWDWPEVD